MKKLLLATAFTLLTTNAYAIDFYCTNFDGTGEDRFISDYTAWQTLKTGSLVYKDQCDRLVEQVYIDPIDNAAGRALGARGDSKPWLSYGTLNIRGLQDVHKEGWTGKDVKTVYFDILWDARSFNSTGYIKEGNHARQVITVGKSTAPDHEAYYYDVYSDFVGAPEDKLFEIAGSKPDKWQHTADTPRITRDWVKKHGADVKVSNASMSPSNTRYALIKKYMPNTLHVEAAGNFSKMTYDDIVSYYGNGRIDANLDNFIIVGAVDKNGKSTFTRAGDAYKHRFMVAHNQTTIYGDTIHGTSFSAPRVAGVATILRGKYPSMSAEEAMVQMLTSAKDLGEPGVDATFGWGLLDAGAALSPVAALR